MWSMTGPSFFQRHRPGEDFYDAKVTVLAEKIKQHVHEQEAPSNGMFAQCRQTHVDLVALRDQLLERKAQLTAEAEKDGLPFVTPNAVRLVAV